MLPLVGLLVFVAPTLFGGDGSVYSAAVLIAIFAVMAYGLDVIVSDLGEVSLAHTVFFAAGSYTAAWLSTRGRRGALADARRIDRRRAAVRRRHRPVTLRLREFVFSLVTYAVAVVAMSVAANWAFLGGSDGLRGMPMLDLSIVGPAADRAQRPRALAVRIRRCSRSPSTSSTGSAIRASAQPRS